ncbi:mannosyltransferase family protein [Streptomyces sp. NPDC004111]|uniref:mannosyltransferase family protein n=1 Tax=Streptomyces sp. NPDC004111 TaxID=3364690 RepID=UPI00367F2CB7
MTVVPPPQRTGQQQPVPGTGRKPAAPDARTSGNGRAARLLGRFRPHLTGADRDILWLYLLTRVGLWVTSYSVAWVFPADGEAKNAPSALSRWAQWDWTHFLHIAQEGYFPPGSGPGTEGWDNREAFFPGFPLLLRVVHVVVPNWTLAGLLISFVAGAVAVLALARIARLHLPGESTAPGSVRRSGRGSGARGGGRGPGGARGAAGESGALGSVRGSHGESGARRGERGAREESAARVPDQRYEGGSVALDAVQRSARGSGAHASEQVTSGESGAHAAGHATSYESTAHATTHATSHESTAPKAGHRAVLFLLLSPCAIFLAAGYTETLFLAFALPAWLAAQRHQWAAAGILTALATTVRISGLFVAAAIGVHFLITAWRARSARAWRPLGWTLVPALPALAYSAYLHSRTGDWMAWKHAQERGWYREFHAPWEAWRTTWQAAFDGGYSTGYAYMWQAELAAMVVGLVLLGVLVWLRRWPEAVYIGLSLWALGTSYWFTSVPRATLLWWPLWTLLAAWSLRRPRVKVAYLAVVAPLMVLFAVSYLSGRWTG